MTLTLVGKPRKVQEVGWNHSTAEDAPAWHIVGDHASVQVRLADATEQEVKDVPNHGKVDLFFPADYTGSVTVTVKGSKSGEETATLSIT